MDPVIPLSDPGILAGEALLSETSSADFPSQGGSS